MDCNVCGGPTSFQKGKLLFKRTKKSCRKTVSAKNKTFFGSQRLLFDEILHMGYLWLCSVEKTEKRRVSAVPVEKRDSETLLDVIKKHVKPGSIIHTDFWRGYERIEKKLGFKHCTVNHSKERETASN
ncbi:Transposase, ISXO2-like domain-containing protein [Strongyloides ratti]|uniref:Transposase, ISXO2-like domain-containing protein n=1 Tax=Strongyloides ratti TaxID=34506 RepID=A0A090KWQ5_STRRB|nr:Transposase, ISXO2-like domain-containing protein [Strongyloides ratti]CEF59667.1 Transposase, ISXO2-like domain-containing protein [Strongyloides ratti]